MIFRAIILILALLLLGFAFYWFQIRTIDIRTKCAKFSDDVKFAELNKSPQTPEEFRRIDQVAATEYTMCLHRNGL